MTTIISMESSKKASIPEVGKEYIFFDDGKTSYSRIYKAKVLRVIPYSEKVYVDKYDYDTQGLISASIQEVHKEEAENFYWIYTPETDYFIECSIPKYDDNTIWFARTKDGGWFSMNIQTDWQSGRLDVDGLINETRDGTPIKDMEL